MDAFDEKRWVGTKYYNKDGPPLPPGTFVHPNGVVEINLLLKKGDIYGWRDRHPVTHELLDTE